MTREETLAAVTEVLRRHAEVRFALLFGSWAREQERPDSDLDVAVQGPGVDALALASELSLATGREVQVQDLGEDLGVPLLDEIIRDGRIVAESVPAASASWRTHALIRLDSDRPWYARMRDAWLRRVAERGL